MNRAELITRYTQLAARIDRISSWLRDAEQWNITGGGLYPITETHMRGGRPITLFDTEGKFVSTHTSRTVTHLRDSEGNLGIRYRQDRPPQGYTKVEGHVLFEA